MIWFEQTCCCHLQRERNRPWAGAEGSGTRQVGGSAHATGRDGSAAAMPLALHPEDTVGKGQRKLLLSDLFM